MKLLNVSCRKEIITAGIWGDRPREGAKCSVLIDAIETKNISLLEVQETEVSSYLGSGFGGTLVIGDGDTDIDTNLDRCIQTMLQTEISLMVLEFFLPSCNIQDDETCLSRGTVKCRVKLKEINNEPYIFEWNTDKKYETALHHKISGVNLYKCGRIRDAFFRFSKSLKLLISMLPVEDNIEQRADITSLRVILCNNIAACHLQCKNYSHVISMCKKVLVIEPGNVKALFRRAIAYMETQVFDKAKEDLNRIQDLEPENVAAQEKQQELKIRQRESDAKLAANIKRMFV